MTSTGSRERPRSTKEMLAVHRVFRRESGLLPRLVQAVPDGDTRQAALIAQAFGDYHLGLHIHHTGEDTLIWPLLLARAGLEADAVARMEPGHQVLARSAEANILPLIEEHLTAAEWAGLGEHLAKAVPPGKRLFFLGALLEEADPGESAIMLGALPALARLAWHLTGRRHYTRKIARIRACLA